jgi:hypothetical protein
LFNRADIYGHLGLAYWGRQWYLDKTTTETTPGGFEYETDHPYHDRKIVPVAGYGGAFHFTDNWAVTINHSFVRQSSSLLHHKVEGKYNYRHPRIGVDVLTFGAVYRF